MPLHRDPSHDDEMLDELLEQRKNQFRPTFKMTPGYEGAVFELGSD